MILVFRVYIRFLCLVFLQFIGEICDFGLDEVIFYVKKNDNFG